MHEYEPMRVPNRFEKIGRAWYIFGVPQYDVNGRTEFAYGPYPNKQDAEQDWLGVLRTMKAWKRYGEEFTKIHPVPNNYLPIEPNREYHSKTKRQPHRAVGHLSKRSGEASVLVFGPTSEDESMGVKSVGVTNVEEPRGASNTTGRGGNSLVHDKDPSERGSRCVRKTRREYCCPDTEYTHGPFGLIEFPGAWTNEDKDYVVVSIP